MIQVKELAQRCHVSPDTVRFYTRIGLLQPARDPVNDYRLFSTSDSKRLDFIRKAKRLGFTLNEIKHILAESNKGKSPCPLVRDLITRRIKANRARLEHLMELQVRMEDALGKWANMPDGTPDGECICLLIESIGKQDAKIASNQEENKQNQ